MPIRGKPSKTHTGLDFETRKGSKYYHRNHHEVRPFAQKRKGGATLNKALLIKLLGGMVKRRPRRTGGANGHTMTGPMIQRGFY